MYAAQVFNQCHDNRPHPVYGAVTSGANWRFLKLNQQIISIDLDEYYLSNLNKILGILIASIRANPLNHP